MAAASEVGAGRVGDRVHATPCRSRSRGVNRVVLGFSRGQGEGALDYVLVVLVVIER